MTISSYALRSLKKGDRKGKPPSSGVRRSSEEESSPYQ